MARAKRTERAEARRRYRAAAATDPADETGRGRGPPRPAALEPAAELIGEVGRRGAAGADELQPRRSGSRSAR